MSTDTAVERISKNIGFNAKMDKKDLQHKLDEYLKKSNSKKLKEIIFSRLSARLKQEISFPIKDKDRYGDRFKIIQQSRKNKIGKVITFTITLKRGRNPFTKEQDSFILRNMSDRNKVLARAFKKKFGVPKSKEAIRDRKARLQGRK